MATKTRARRKVAAVTTENFGEMLIQSAREAVAIARGKAKPARITRLTARDVEAAEPPEYGADDVRRIREGLGLSQDVFAQVLGSGIRGVQSWEQGKRKPDGPARRLLQVAERTPGVLLATAGIEVIVAPSHAKR